MFSKVALSALIVLCLISQGMGQCNINDLKITTSATGEQASGKPIQKVIVENACFCGQSNMVIDATGLQSAAPLVNLTKVDAKPNEYLVNNGDIIYPQESTTFSYAWDEVFSFTPVDSQISCS
ncbi:hypothetical protein QQ045_000046 [Rhodiola kirilowii]